MSVIGIEEALCIVEAQKANRCKISADAVLILLECKEVFQVTLDGMTVKEKMQLRNQIARIVRDIYEG